MIRWRDTSDIKLGTVLGVKLNAGEKEVPSTFDINVFESKDLLIVKTDAFNFFIKIKFLHSRYPAFLLFGVN